MDLAAALRAYVRIVEKGTVTAAALDLGISQPAVSKLLRNLESHTGARLLERGARSVRPTALGLHLFQASGGALATIDAAIEAVRGEASAIGGVLRLHGPACVGEQHLHRIVMAFQDQHPGVSVELTLENHPVDLVHHKVDLALRMGLPKEQSLVVRAIGASRRILVASPDYLARHGPVRDQTDLRDHAIVVTDASLSARSTLTLCRARQTVEVFVRPIMTTNSAQVLINSLKASRGIGTAQVLLVAEDIREGRLIRVLPRYEVRPTELFLVYPSARYLRPAVRAFIDFAVPALRRVEGIARTSDPTALKATSRRPPARRSLSA